MYQLPPVAMFLPEREGDRVRQMKIVRLCAASRIIQFNGTITKKQESGSSPELGTRPSEEQLAPLKELLQMAFGSCTGMKITWSGLCPK